MTSENASYEYILDSAADKLERNPSILQSKEAAQLLVAWLRKARDCERDNFYPPPTDTSPGIIMAKYIIDTESSVW